MLITSQTNRRLLVPTGLIVPYDSDASAPAGWSVWTSADGKYIVGAGSTYAVAATGGSTTVDQVSDTAGAHVNNLGYRFTGYWQSTGGGVSFPFASTDTSAGDHTHTATLTPIIAKREQRFIKAAQDLPEFPANAVLFGAQSFASPYANIYSGDNKLVRANSARANAATSITGTTSSDGDHNHNNGTRNVTANIARDRAVNAGGHTHTVAATIQTEAIKKVYLTAWTNASVAFRAVSGIIAMYENTTPPTGWYLCDGNNGTVDLRDYFIMIGTEANHGTSTGDNTLTITTSATTLESTNWTHSHLGSASSTNTISGNVYHSSANSVHSHDLAAHVLAFLPQYYALAFIQKW
jgi:hypothetical protein